ncbi:dihydroneopterin aldolase [Helicobacter labetoulli]|uniref:dihydroneopterin aldolase n=1 Tax=Helicobacter labetoulli TaxID=2315333 RepID=UPI000EF65CA1|nr:dihydroneopterin aldolase [Helicobacter labetoulli]
MSKSITLHIENLCIQTIIGILEKERCAPQAVEVNAEITYTYTDAFLDYVEICNLITSSLQNNAYGLLETALLDIAKMLKNHSTKIQKLTLHIKKPTILESCIVGASLTQDFTQTP